MVKDDLATRLWQADSLPAVRAILKAAGLDPAGIVPDAPEAPPYHIPGPYEIALTVGAALAATGRFETPGAALAAAWFAVPEFFQGRDAYLLEMVPAIYGRQHAGAASSPATSPPEGGDRGKAAA